MTERIVTINLSAKVAGFAAGMANAKRSADDLKKSLDNAVANRSEQLTTVGIGLAALGTAMTAASVLTVKAAADFDKAMSTVKADTQESASNMELLRNAAIKAGADSIFSATEAAGAIDELGKAGVSTADILGGALNSSLNLASAGGLSIEDAASTAATAMTIFGLKGTDVAHVSDLLAAGAGKAQGSVLDLSMALKQGGLVAKASGLSIDETVGALAAFASQGLLSADAGTSMKSMLQRLTPQSAEAASKMKDLGISAYDSQGNFVGLANFAGNLQDSLKGLTVEQRNSALATIFGSDAVRAANILYEQGQTGIQGWINKVNDSGYASKVAADRLDNLAGDFEQLSGAVDTLLISTGESAQGPLRGLVQMATDVVNGINQLPQPIKDTGFLLTAAAAGLTVLAGAAFVGIPKFYALKRSWDELNISGAKLGKGLKVGGLIMLGLTAVSGAVSSLGSMANLSAADVAKLNASFDTGNMKQLGKEFVDVNGATVKFSDSLNNLYTSNFFGSYNSIMGPLNGAIKQLSGGLIDLGAYADTNKAKFNQIGEALGSLAKEDLPSATAKFNEFVKMTDGSDESVRQLTVAFPQYTAELHKQAAALGITLSDQDLLNVAQGKGEKAAQLTAAATARQKVELGKLSAAATDTTDAVGNLADAIDSFNQTQFDADDAVSAFNQSLIDVSKAMGADGFVGTLDESTQQGIDNNQMLRELAKNANEAASKTLELTGNQADANKILQSARDRLAEIGGQFGLSGQELQAFIDKYVASPKEIAYNAKITGLADAQGALDRWLIHNDGRSIRIGANVVLHAGQIAAHASGGTVAGVGSSKSDSNIVALSRGEEVIQEPYASWNRSALKLINAGMLRLAGGGTVPEKVYLSNGYGAGSSAGQNVRQVTLIGEYNEAAGSNRGHKQQVLAALRVASSALGLEAVG